MNAFRRGFLFLSVLLGTLELASPAFAHSGHTDWGPWRFNWEVKDDAGIAIRNVLYKDELVIYKASLPVIRVRYNDNACGPYADRINWNNLLNISNCGGVKVCQKSYAAGGQNWLEIGVLAQIGSYRIYQVWYLSEGGQITARLWSKGLQCQTDHEHHPYWRMDFDINGAPNDQVFVRNDGATDEGWGPGWHKYTNELNDRKNPSTNRLWFVRDNPTGHGVWILPGPDGTSDDFSNRDVAPRLYRGSEDVPWAFGAGGDVGYDDGEDIQEKDIVFWYVAHLHHVASGGGDQWHWVGPTLMVHR